MSIKGASLIGLAAFGLLTLFHAVVLPLSADEAHYALYGSMVDWSYFDHPPLVGWLQSVALWFSSDEFSLRVIPLLLTVISLFLLFSLCVADFGKPVGYMVVLLFVSMPIVQVLAMAMIPETPLVLAGVLNIWVLKRIEANGGKKYQEWIFLGLILGFAGLSKYTGIILALSSLVVLWLQFGKHIFRQLGFYFCGIVAGLLITPVLYWNFENQWLSFLYQLNHGAGKSTYNPVDLVYMQLTQLVAYGPLVYVGGIIAIFKLYANSKAKIWLIFALPILIIFSFLSMKGRSLPHWTELGVIFMLPLIAKVIMDSLESRVLKRTFMGLGACSLSLTLIVQTIVSYPKIPFQDYSHPLADLIGWKTISQRLPVQAQAGDNVFVTNWSYASRVAWYARPLEVKVMDSRFDQFDLWYGAPQIGDAGLVLLHGGKNGFATDVLKRFVKCHQVDALEVTIQDSYVNYFKIYRCLGYLGTND